jgi:hypothetical protein
MSSDPDDDEAVRAARIKAAASVDYPLWSYANKPSGPHESWELSQPSGRFAGYSWLLIGVALGLVVSFVAGSVVPLLIGMLLGLLIWLTVSWRAVQKAAKPSSDYPALDFLRMICLVCACGAPLVGLVASIVNQSWVPVLAGLLSGLSLWLTASWTKLAIDIATQTRVSACEIKELRVLLSQQSNIAAKANSANQ